MVYDRLHFYTDSVLLMQVPAEYGIGNDQKRRVGSLVAGPLVTRVRQRDSSRLDVKFFSRRRSLFVWS